MRTKTIVAASVIAASVTAGAVGGALLFAPSLSGADETTTITADGPEDGVRHPGPGAAKFGGLFGAGLDVAAEAIGISESDLRDALADGKSIADVAEEHGVEVQKVIDALVAAAKEKLDELEASLPDRITELVNGTMPAFGFEHRGRGPGHLFGPVFGAGLDAAADAIGISESELRDARSDGKSIADVAEEHDVDVQKVIDALVAASTKAIDQAVEDGKVDEDRAAELKSNLTNRVTAFVNGEHAMGPGPGPRFRHFGDAPSSEGEGEGATYTS